MGDDLRPDGMHDECKHEIEALLVEIKELQTKLDAATRETAEAERTPWRSILVATAKALRCQMLTTVPDATLRVVERAKKLRSWIDALECPHAVGCATYKEPGVDCDCGLEGLLIETADWSEEG